MSQNIANKLKKCVEKTPLLENSAGIINGKAGLILCYSYMYDTYHDNDFLIGLYTMVNELTEKFNQNYTLGYGCAGLAWALSILPNELFENTKEWLEDMDVLLEENYYQMVQKGNIDFFNGAIGILFYFLAKKNVSKEPLSNMVNVFIDFILDRLEKDRLWIKKTNTFDRNICDVINLGTPHGLTGVLLILLLVKEKVFCLKLDYVVQRMIELLKSFEIVHADKYPHFPSLFWKDGKKSFSSLAWCYGDLMIAYGILKAGLIYKEKKYQDYGMNILEESIERKNHHKEQLALCHGFPSLSHIYYHIYQLTNSSIFKVQYKYFKQQTIAQFEERFNLYKRNNYDSFFETPSLLIGYSGCFLSLLCWQSDYKYKDWIKFLLI